MYIHLRAQKYCGGPLYPHQSRKCVTPHEGAMGRLYSRCVSLSLAIPLQRRTYRIDGSRPSICVSGPNQRKGRYDYERKSRPPPLGGEESRNRPRRITGFVAPRS